MVSSLDWVVFVAQALLGNSERTRIVTPFIDMKQEYVPPDNDYLCGFSYDRFRSQVDKILSSNIHTIVLKLCCPFPLSQDVPKSLVGEVRQTAVRLEK